MDPLEMDQVPPEVDALEAALEEARFRHVAGLSEEPSLARPFADRHRVAHRDTVAALRAAGREPLALRVSALRAERAAAVEEEAWRAADARASAIGPDGPALLVDLERALPRERDPERREALARAAAEAMAAAASAREAWIERRARARAEAGVPPDWQAVVAGDQVLAASEDAYRDVAAFAARRALGAGAREVRGLSRADLLHVVLADRWDGVFRSGMLPVALKFTVERLGLELERVRIDDAPRAAKWPGVHACGARISLGARGGAADWQDLLAAVGSALFAAAQPPHARDPVVGEAIAWVLGSLVLEPRWLADRADVEPRHAADVVRDLALRRLLALRADAAALRVATEVERGLSGAAWRSAYRDALGAATGATWDGVRAARDADAPRLAARLRGAAEGERLRLALRERFDEDYWRNPRTAAHLAGLLAAGSLPAREDGRDDPGPLGARMLAGKLEAGR